MTPAVHQSPKLAHLSQRVRETCRSMEPWLALGALSDHPSTVHHAGIVFPLPIPPLGLPCAVAQWPQGDEWGIRLGSAQHIPVPGLQMGRSFPTPPRPSWPAAS